MVMNDEEGLKEGLGDPNAPKKEHSKKLQYKIKYTIWKGTVQSTIKGPENQHFGFIPDIQIHSNKIEVVNFDILIQWKLTGYGKFRFGGSSTTIKGPS